MQRLHMKPRLNNYAIYFNSPTLPAALYRAIQ